MMRKKLIISAGLLIILGCTGKNTELSKVEFSTTNSAIDITKRQNEEWLESNKQKTGIVTLSSGLQYRILKEGDGEHVKNDQFIVCHYTGRFIDNAKFESTYDNGAPFRADASGVVQGWREVLPMMQVGSVWELYIPYYLGYGSDGIKDKIPPFATLVYEIELIGVGKN